MCGVVSRCFVCLGRKVSLSASCGYLDTVSQTHFLKHYLGGAGGCDQCDFPRNPAATLCDAPETQSAEQCAQRRQGRAGQGSAAGLPYERA